MTLSKKVNLIRELSSKLSTPIIISQGFRLMEVDLDPSNIAAIRKFIDAQTSRSELKNLALSAGAKSE